MIFKLLIVCALIASPAIGSAIKGYSAPPAKGGQAVAASPVEQVRQQREEFPAAEQKVEELQQQHQQQLEETVRLDEAAPVKGGRYEAKPQLSRDEQAKGEKLTKYEQVVVQKQQQEPLVEQAPLSKTSQQQPIKYEQFKEQQYEQVELQQQREEQVQQQEQVQVQVLQAGAVKGGELSAPLGQAEPYAFSYQHEGSSRSESGDVNGVVRGQYTVQGGDGSSRVVDYVADANGFRASVNTNEFGTEARAPASVNLRSSQPSAEEITLRLDGKTRLSNSEEAVKGQQQIVVAASAPEVVRVAPAPAKGQLRVEEAPEPQQQLVNKASSSSFQQQPTKSAELRAPKALPSSESSESSKLPAAPAAAPASLKSPARQFESATAHRVYRAQSANNANYVYVAPQQAPVVQPPVVRASALPIVRAQPPPPLVRVAAPVPVGVAPITRQQLQRERYPPSPVQAAASYNKRQHHSQPILISANEQLPAAAIPPRVSFYAQPSSGASSSSLSYDEEQPAGFEQ